MNSPAKPKPSEPNRKPQLLQKQEEWEALSLPERQAYALSQRDKWQRIMNRPELSPQAALAARNLYRSYSAAVRLGEKALEYEARVNDPQAQAANMRALGIKPLLQEPSPTPSETQQDSPSPAVDTPKPQDNSSPPSAISWNAMSSLASQMVSSEGAAHVVDEDRTALRAKPQATTKDNNSAAVRTSEQSAALTSTESLQSTGGPMTVDAGHKRITRPPRDTEWWNRSLDDQTITILAVLFVGFCCWLLWPLVVSSFMLLGVAAVLVVVGRGVRKFIKWNWYN
jgi:hypothetical protein